MDRVRPRCRSVAAGFRSGVRRETRIFYVEGTVLMAAPVQTAPAFSSGAPKRLFELEPRARDLNVYDTLDGQRFIVV